MDDWRSPKAKIKHLIRSAVFRGFSLAGQFQQVSKDELLTLPCETVEFFGHRVGGATEMGPQRETRLAFQQTRPPYQEVADLTYSESGMAWVNGCLIEKFSVQPIRMSDLARRPASGVRKIDTCAVVECDYTYSYGDWVHCYLGTILASSFPDVPVLVPKYLAEKGYVRRDLGRANVNWVVADGWSTIERAIVLRKPNPNFYWSAQNVAAFRKAFSIDPAPPVSGSVSYLGRFDLKGETVNRTFPSDRVADYIRGINGTVVRQSDLNTSSSLMYAKHTETVIGDHGSGLLNILFWNPKTVIELVVDDWWVNNSLFVAAGIGVENFGVIRVDGLSSDEIGARIEACQDFFDRRAKLGLSET